MDNEVIGESGLAGSRCIRKQNWSCSNCGDRKPGLIKQENEQGDIFLDQYLHNDCTFLEIVP